ncbi:hypothetical protein PG593_11130 [Riemerella anatipestifer]|nr:hypothetical protein [Riemerella anatipestifer]
MENKVFFKEQLLSTLNNSLGGQVLSANMTFVILPSNADNEKPKNTWDEIINWWVLPTSTELKLSLDQVLETLTSRQGLLPLWIKVKHQSEDLIILNISRRFRKLKDIKEFHKDNQNMPFILDNSIEYEFTSEIQKIGLTRKLLWNFELTEQEKRFFEKAPLTFADIRQFAENHFDNYNYFPPDYNHRKPDTKRYSKLVIKKDTEFSILENIGTTNEKSILTTTDIDKILDTYLNKEMNYRIDNLTINK